MGRAERRRSAIPSGFLVKAADYTGPPQTTGERVFCSLLVACVPSLLLALAAYAAGPALALAVFGASLIGVSAVTFVYLAPAESAHELAAELEGTPDPGRYMTAAEMTAAEMTAPEMTAPEATVEWPGIAGKNGTSPALPIIVLPAPPRVEFESEQKLDPAPWTNGVATARAGTWRSCAHCSSDFLPRRANMKYCSPSCRIDAARDRRRTAGAEHAKRSSTPVSTRG